jgi:glycosyltransferase involved in cell wall biosynthesis
LIKVAFWFDAPAEYSGGVNYFRNLLYSLSLVNDDSIHPYIFLSNDIPESIESELTHYATIIRTKMLQRGTVHWFIYRVMYKIFGSMIFVNSLLKSHKIDVLSHVWFVYKGKSPFHIIGWIPDFQYLHLPEFFPNLDSDKETRKNQLIIAQSEILLLSSHNALKDFKRIAAPHHQVRARVLQFTSQPSIKVSTNTVSRENLEQKYSFNGHYFFLPNQFWAHKNHIVVLKAVKLLKDIGINILVICTGNTKDYRIKDSKYIDSIHEFIETHGLQVNVLILGLIDYTYVLSLMRHSLAVINPSRFEGWSSSVEEAKSMGKVVILSRIDVHVEQNPINGRYFEAEDPLGLSQILLDVWRTSPRASDEDDELLAKEALQERTLMFGRNYLTLLKGIMGKINK